MKIKLLTIAAIAICMASSLSLSAQSTKEYKVSMTSGTLSISDIDDIVIEGYTGSEIVFSTTVDDREMSDRAAGLKVLNSLGLDDNTGFGISVEQEGNTVVATQIGNECDCNQVTVMVPKGIDVKLSHTSHNARQIEIKNISSELEITTNYHDVVLEDVTGPMTVKTIYGKIEGSFSSLSQTGSVSLYSVYDLVDLTLPASSKADLTVSTPYGSVYSNIDINVTSRKKATSNSCGSTGSTIDGTINGGGVDFIVKSAYEDVYLRI